MKKTDNLTNHLKSIFSRRRILLFLGSVFITVLCLAILILKIFYPYHRAIAFILLISSWLIFFIPLLKKIKNHDKLKKEHSRRRPNRSFFSSSLIILIVFTAIIISLLIYGLFLLFPRDDKHNLGFLKNGPDFANEKAETDLLDVQDVIVSLDNSYNDLVKSGLLRLTIEDSNPENVKELKDHFKKIVDHIIVLDQYVLEYQYFYQADSSKYPDLNTRAFLIFYGSYTANYQTVFELSNEIDGNKYVELLLNEEMDEIGQKDVYQKLKNKLNHPDSILRLNLGRTYLEYIQLRRNIPQNAHTLLEFSIDSYSAVFGNFDQSVKLSIGSILDTFEKKTVSRWLPVQKSIGVKLTTSRISSRNESYISYDDINWLYPLLEPGDILFQRRDWLMSNVGMPGYWTHSVLYTGTFEELDSYFYSESHYLLNMSVSEYIKKNYPSAYELKKTKYDGRYNYTTIEVKKEGVIILPMEVSSKVDSIAAIRPSLSKEVKLKAILYAFQKYGKPYDYDFDFSTDDSYLCSELIYKAYSPTSTKDGLRYTLIKRAGRWMVAPNDMVHSFDTEYGTSGQQFDFLFFLDGNAKSGKSEEKGVSEFRESWKRSKYTNMLN
jgi:hypothetical protein